MSDLDRYLAPPKPPPSGDPLLADLLERRRREASLYIVHDGETPDKAAKANQLARRFGVPAETVERNLPQFEAAARGREASEMMRRYPAIGKWAAEPRHAAVARDDVPGLANISRAFHDYSEGQEIVRAERAAGYRKRFGDLKATAAPAPTAANFFSGIGSDFVLGASQTREGMRLAVSDLVGSEAGIARSRRAIERTEARIAGNQPDFAPGLAGTTLRGLYSGVSSLAQIAPATVASVAMGTPVPVLGYAGTMSGFRAYGKYRARGAPAGQAALGGAGEGAIEVATELMPMKYLVGAFGKVGFGAFVAGVVGRDVPGEQVATLVQDAIDASIANPEMTVGQFIKERPGAAYETLVASVAQGLLLGGPSALARRVSRRGEAEQAEGGAAFLEALSTSAQESKVRERDPEAFRRFIEEHSDGTEVENVYVPAEALRELYQSSDRQDDGFFDSYSGQVTEAFATGGDVVVPLAEVATRLFGTPAWDAIKDDVRLSVLGESPREARAFNEAMSDETAAMWEEQSALMEAERAAAEPREKIAETVRDKLMLAGFRPDVAMSYAELWAARYATRAARMGQEITGAEASQVQIQMASSEDGTVSLGALANEGNDQAVVLQALIDGGGVGAQQLADVLEGVATLPEADRLGSVPALSPMLSLMRSIARENPKVLDSVVRLVPVDMVNNLFGSEAAAKVALHHEAMLKNAPAFDGNLSVADLSEASRSVRLLVLEAASKTAKLAGIARPSGGSASKNGATAVAREFSHRKFSKGRRAAISIGSDLSTITISLFEESDLSSFLHESGHLFLEELKADADVALGNETPEARQVFADFEAVKAWFKREGHEIGADGSIPTEAHELWARGFERFAMEGKAPTSALRRAFEAFRSWLLTIYKVIENLRSPITPEIREVMERLIATDEEITAAREEQNIKALFTSAEQAGMTEAEFAAYRTAAVEARDEAHDALLYRTMAAIRKRKTKEWREEEAGVLAEATEGVDRQPVFKALRLLTTGVLGEGEPRRVKLDRKWLVDTYGAEALEALPKRVHSDRETSHADIVAEMTGFSSGDEMVRTMMGLEEQTKALRVAGDKRSVRQAQIDEITAATMLERNGDILNDGSIEDEARALIHNDRQGEVIASEIRALARRANKRPTPYRLAREWAAGRIAQSKVVEAVSGAALQRYERAARLAAKKAEEAILAGDVDETYRQKQAQMLNNALISEAKKAKDSVDAAVVRLGKLARRATAKTIDQGHLDQAHQLLEQVEFRTRSQRDIDRQKSFEKWAEAQEAAGFDVVVPASFATSLGRTHWSRLSVEQLLGLDETVKQIVHLGRLKQSLADGQERRAFEDVVGEALASVGNLPPRPPADLMEPSFGDRLKARIENADTALLKAETLVDWLDGKNSEGVFNRIVFKPIADAQARAGDMFVDYVGRLNAVLAKVPKGQLRRWGDRVEIPELINPETGEAWRPTRQRLISAALNMGNEGNAQRLADGNGWSQDAIFAVLRRELSVEEWAYVQDVWDTLDGLWPQIEAMEKRLNGVAPERVEARSLETSAGTLRGGYFPVVYDSTRDYAAERNAARESDLFEAKYTRANTKASATKERAEAVTRPILLDLGVITRHVGEVIHDVTHREAVMNADRFLTDERVMKAIDSSLGPAARKQFRPWLKFVANQWAAERAGNEGMGAFIGKLRTNATVVGMGFRVSTMMMQLAGYSNSFEVVGASWVGAAVAQTTQHPVETFEFVMARSGEIRHRMGTLDRDIAEGVRKLAGQRSPLTAAKRFAFHGIGYMDRVVVIPTWMGAYNKALAVGMEEEAAIYAADKAVRQSQGSAGAKDLAAVARGTGQWGQALKLLTMFYSYMSAVYQRQRTLGRDIRHARSEDVPGLMARAWWLMIVPPLLAEMLAGRGPDDDEDWGWWATKQSLFQSLGPIPVVRDLARPVWDKLAGTKGFDYQLSPVQSAGQSVVKVAEDARRLWRGDETKRATRDVLEMAGYWTGLVPGQVAAATQFLVDVGAGDQDPQDLGDWYEGLTKGKIKRD